MFIQQFSCMLKEQTFTLLKCMRRYLIKLRGEVVFELYVIYIHKRNNALFFDPVSRFVVSHLCTPVFIHGGFINTFIVCLYRDIES